MVIICREKTDAKFFCLQANSRNELSCYVLEKSSVCAVDNCFRGIELDMGMDSDWHFSATWSLYGNIFGGLFFGHCRLNHHVWWDYKKADRINLVENRHCLIPSLQMQCGEYVSQDIIRNVHNILLLTVVLKLTIGGDKVKAFSLFKPTNLKKIYFGGLRI